MFYFLETSHIKASPVLCSLGLMAMSESGWSIKFDQHTETSGQDSKLLWKLALPQAQPGNTTQAIRRMTENRISTTPVVTKGCRVFF